MKRRLTVIAFIILILVLALYGSTLYIAHGDAFYRERLLAFVDAHLGQTA
jgi:hypothetical protein